jgi:DNA-binding NtrC family response regulator
LLRVGGTKPRRVQVRVVAATNRQLRDEVDSGRFREDLFFRLSVIPLQIPPLRDRKEEILPLARHFIHRHSGETGRTLSLSSEAERSLLTHSWPGNVRELENAIERAVILSQDDVTKPEDLLLEQKTKSIPSEAPKVDDIASMTLQQALDRTTTTRIYAALDQVSGNRSAAARMLGVDRATFYRLMNRLALGARN